MEVPLEKKWYVLKTRSGQEYKVKSYIENEVYRSNLKDYLGQILIPIEKGIHIRNGKNIHKRKKFFPGYLIIEASLKEELLHIIKTSPGVSHFLSECKGGKPIPLRKGEVVNMLGEIDDLNEKGYIGNLPFTLSEKVKVVDGPFTGFNGKIENIDNLKNKLEISVLIFGRKTPLELSFTQVEKL